MEQALEIAFAHFYKVEILRYAIIKFMPKNR